MDVPSADLIGENASEADAAFLRMRHRHQAMLAEDDAERRERRRRRDVRRPGTMAVVVSTTQQRSTTRSREASGSQPTRTRGSRRSSCSSRSGDSGDSGPSGESDPPARRGRALEREHRPLDQRHVVPQQHCRLVLPVERGRS